MRKRIPIGVCILVTIMSCIATYLITSIAMNSSHQQELNVLKEKASFYDKLSDVFRRVETSYIKGTEESNMDDAYLGAYIASLDDPYSAYLTKEEMEEYLSANEGNMIGIGINAVLDDDTGGIYVARVMNGSPAQKAGLLKGDIIIQAGDLEINNNFDEAIQVIRGNEGEAVTLKVKRDSEILEFTIVREKFPYESVIYEALDYNIAYITITEFDDKTAEAFAEALEKAKNDGCEKYLFDVRNNPGGDLNAIVAVLDKLLPEGPIINIVDRKGNTTTKRSDAACLEAPMVVLVNENTASAAELFTAALRDYKLATIVGTTTFGKGTMQTITTLPDGSGLRLSTYYYNPPFGENYNGVGITPDVVIEMPEELSKKFYKLTKEEDNQLQKAIEILK